jgi:hypothetical protein
MSEVSGFLAAVCRRSKNNCETSENCLRRSGLVEGKRGESLESTALIDVLNSGRPFRSIQGHGLCPCGTHGLARRNAAICEKQSNEYSRRDFPQFGYLTIRKRKHTPIDARALIPLTARSYDENRLARRATVTSAVTRQSEPSKFNSVIFRPYLSSPVIHLRPLSSAWS